jgi:hypothetical protein
VRIGLAQARVFFYTEITEDAEKKRSLQGEWDDCQEWDAK